MARPKRPDNPRKLTLHVAERTVKILRRSAFAANQSMSQFVDSLVQQYAGLKIKEGAK